MQIRGENRRLVKFIWAALVFFAWGLIQGAVQTQEPVRLFLEQGPAAMVGSAHVHIALMGWLSLALMAAVYYLVPLFSGKSIVWPKLIDWVFWIFAVCVAVSGILMIIGGIVGGRAFTAGVTGAALARLIVPYAMPGGLLCTISAISGLMFIVQILVSLSRGYKVAD